MQCRPRLPAPHFAPLLWPPKPLGVGVGGAWPSILPIMLLTRSHRTIPRVGWSFPCKDSRCFYAYSLALCAGLLVLAMRKADLCVGLTLARRICLWCRRERERACLPELTRVADEGEEDAAALLVKLDRCVPHAISGETGQSEPQRHSPQRP